MKKLMTVLQCASMLWTVAAHAAFAIQPFEPDSMARIIASQNGKSFVLIVWSIDCEFCQASLNTLAQEKRRHRNLQVVTLATDPLGDAQVVALMKKKLASVGITGNAWAFGAAPPEQLRYAVDSKWHGEMPRSYWFNAHGEKTAYSGVITPAVVAKFTAK